MNVHDQILAVAIVRMSLAGKDDLDRPDLADNLLEPVEILKDQTGTFVGRKPTGEPYCQHVAIKPRVRFPIYMLDEGAFRFHMSRPDISEGNAHGIAKRELIAPPVRQMGIKELLERRSGPRNCVDSVGNGMDRVAGEHAVRNLPMLHRNPIDIPGAMQGQLCQIQCLPIVAGLQQSAPAISQHASSEFLGKLIVTGRHGGMGRKDTLFTNFFDEVG